MQSPLYRRWRRVMWVAAWIAAILAATWGLSMRWTLVRYRTNGLGIFAVGFGALVLKVEKHPGATRELPKYAVVRRDGAVRWTFGAYDDPLTFGMAVPFWMLALPPAAVSLLAWRRARKHGSVAYCNKCGYSR